MENKNDNSYITDLLGIGIGIVYVILVFYLAFILFPDGNDLPGYRISGNENLANRTILIGLVSILTMAISAFSLREYKEVFSGLFYGGIIALAVSLGYSYFTIKENSPQSTAIYLGVLLISLVAFTFFADEMIPEEKIVIESENPPENSGPKEVYPTPKEHIAPEGVAANEPEQKVESKEEKPPNSDISI